MNKMIDYFIGLVKRRYSDEISSFELPPESFKTMKAEFVTIDPDKKYLEVKFPVQTATLNPFGNMQGGMIAAAVDNAIGPLSMIVAPVNFTRDLVLKYKSPVKGSFEYITVKAVLEKQDKRKLFFSAKVLDPEGNILVTAKSMNWIVGDEWLKV